MSKGPRSTRDFGLARLISADAEKLNVSASSSVRSFKIPKLATEENDDIADFDEFTASISADLMFAQQKLPIFIKNTFSKNQSLKRASLELINSFLREKYPPLHLTLASSLQGTSSLILLNTESCEVLDFITI
ncbi:MAG: hypothetical protein K2X77_00680 [Candidatus Obscuribacterales bacterium]|nr:hypothetical protein [Candidatus Obscuribacterales bacterium]